MKLSSVLASICTAVYVVSAYEEVHDFMDGHQMLVKRDHGLPYSTLPSTTCATPSSCSNIGGTVTCRCSDTITTCVNTSGQYCWGSIALNQTSCPSVPTSCSSTLTGTSTTCLCNSQNVLCVDNANNYCYGSVVSGSVAITALPYAASSAASSAVSSAVSSAASTAASSGTNPTMSVIGAPSNNANAPTTSPTSGSNKLTTTASLVTFASAFITYYLAIH